MKTSEGNIILKKWKSLSPLSRVLFGLLIAILIFIGGEKFILKKFKLQNKRFEKVYSSMRGENVQLQIKTLKQKQQQLLHALKKIKGNYSITNSGNTYTFILSKFDTLIDQTGLTILDSHLNPQKHIRNVYDGRNKDTSQFEKFITGAYKLKGNFRSIFLFMWKIFKLQPSCRLSDISIVRECPGYRDITGKKNNINNTSNQQNNILIFSFTLEIPIL